MQDLLEANPVLRSKAANGDLSYATMHRFTSGGKAANLVLGPTDQSVDPDDSDFGHPIVETEPAEIWFAIRVTALMTQLGRNVTNRRGDIQSMSQEAFRKNEETVTAGLFFTTIADEVQYEHHDSPTSEGLGAKEVNTVVEKLSEAMSISDEATGDLDGVGLIVLDWDGRSEPSIYENTPAPDPDSTLFYDNFISNISDLIDERFLGIPDPQSASAEDFIGRGEGKTIEFKEELDSDARNLAKEAISMLNTSGGVILIGVTDQGEVAGLDDIDSVQNQSANILRDYIEDIPEISWDRENVEGEDILLIRLPKSEDRLYDLNGVFFTRFGESNMPMSYRELETFVVNRIINEHNLRKLVDEQ